MLVVFGSVWLLIICLGAESSPVDKHQTTDGISWSRGKDVDCWHQCGEKGGFCPSVCGEYGWCCRWDFLSDNCPEQARDTSTYGYHSCVQGKSGIKEKPSKASDSVVTNIKSEDEVILVIGGSPSHTEGSSSEILDLSLTSTCKNPVPPLPSPRWGHTVNYVNNTLILCGGGYNSSTQTSCIQARWDHDSTTSAQLRWEHHSTTTGLRWGHSSVLGERIHLIGGVDSDAGRTTESFQQGEWRQGSSLNYSIGVGSCSVEVEGGVVVTEGAGAMEKVGVWDVGSGSWSEDLEDMPVGRFDHGCAVVVTDGRTFLVVAGGHDGFRRVRSSAVMDVGRNTWNVVGDLKEARRAGKMVVVRVEGRDRLVMLGGEDEGRNVLDTVEELVINTDNLEDSRWVKDAVSMEVGRYGFDAVAVQKQKFCK